MTPRPTRLSLSLTAFTATALLATSPFSPLLAQGTQPLSVQTQQTPAPRGSLLPNPLTVKSPLPNHADGVGPSGPVELRIVSPRPDEIIPIPPPAPGGTPGRSAPVEIKFEIKNYEIFQDPITKTGQHVHVILDNQPYFADYDISKPWLFKNVPAGTHTIRAFPSRPWHESIKEPGAFAMVTFHVGEKDGKNTPVAGVPLLTYSRPKGKYGKDEAAKVMLDFYVTGCQIAEESVPDSCRVRYKLDDQPEMTLTKWAPVWWEGLGVGKHSYVIGLTRGGKVVENGSFNLVKPSFEVEATNSMAPGSPAPAAAAPGGAPGGAELSRPVPGPGGNDSGPPTRPARPAGGFPEPTRPPAPGPGGR
ncbi:MAG: hypothetical protein ABIT01_20435 [Thermoanaerobaculia bacterium]